eukprot:556353-Rhodomonas_salina.1
MTTIDCVCMAGSMNVRLFPDPVAQKMHVSCLRRIANMASSCPALNVCMPKWSRSVCRGCGVCGVGGTVHLQVSSLHPHAPVLAMVVPSAVG